eukprot:712171_1
MSLSYSAFSNRQLPPLPTSSSGYFLPPRQTTQSVSQSSHDSSVYQSSSHSGLSSNEHPGTQSPFVNQRLHIVPENSHALADFQQTSELYASFQPPPVNSYMPSSFSNCYRPHVPSRPHKINSLRQPAPVSAAYRTPLVASGRQIPPVSSTVRNYQVFSAQRSPVVSSTNRLYPAISQVNQPNISGQSFRPRSFHSPRPLSSRGSSINRTKNIPIVDGELPQLVPISPGPIQFRSHEYFPPRHAVSHNNRIKVQPIKRDQQYLQNPELNLYPQQSPGRYISESSSVRREPNNNDLMLSHLGGQKVGVAPPVPDYQCVSSVINPSHIQPVHSDIDILPRSEKSLVTSSSKTDIISKLNIPREPSQRESHIESLNYISPDEISDNLCSQQAFSQPAVPRNIDPQQFSERRSDVLQFPRITLTSRCVSLSPCSSFESSDNLSMSASSPVSQSSSAVSEAMSSPVSSQLDRDLSPVSRERSPKAVELLSSVSEPHIISPKPIKLTVP